MWPNINLLWTDPLGYITAVASWLWGFVTTVLGEFGVRL